MTTWERQKNGKYKLSPSPVKQTAGTLAAKLGNLAHPASPPPLKTPAAPTQQHPLPKMCMRVCARVLAEEDFLLSAGQLFLPRAVHNRVGTTVSEFPIESEDWSELLSSGKEGGKRETRKEREHHSRPGLSCLLSIGIMCRHYEHWTSPTAFMAIPTNSGNTNSWAHNKYNGLCSVSKREAPPSPQGFFPVPSVRLCGGCRPPAARASLLRDQPPGGASPPAPTARTPPTSCASSSPAPATRCGAGWCRCWPPCCPSARRRWRPCTDATTNGARVGRRPLPPPASASPASAPLRPALDDPTTAETQTRSDLCCTVVRGKGYRAVLSSLNVCP